MAGIKIVNLPAVGRDLISTDLFELSLVGGSGSRKITGQEIMNASKLNVGGTPIINGTVGRILFQGASDTLGESANLFWDNTNGRLGIGTSSPSTKLVLQQDGGSFIRLVRNLSTTEFGMFITNVRNGVGQAGAVFTANNYEFRNSTDTGVFLTINGGNVLIGTTTDAGYKLDVNGTARVSGQATIQGMTVGLGGGANTNSVAIGLVALINNSSGTANTAVGSSTLNALTSGSANTAIGFSSLGGTNGTNNTGVGNSSLRNITSGSLNTAVGAEAGRYISDGVTNLTSSDNSLFLGMSSRPLANSQTNQIVIGYNAIGAGSNSVVLGNDSITTTLLKGNVGIGTNAPTNQLTLNNTLGSVDPLKINVLGNGGISIERAVTGGIFALRVNSGGKGVMDCTTDFALNTGGSPDRLVVKANGNVLINTTTDAGFKLDVNGTARVSGLIDSTNTFTSIGAFSTGIGLSKTTINSSTSFSEVISVQGLARSLNNFAYRVYGVKGIGATDGSFGTQSIEILTGLQGAISVGNGNKTVTTAMSLFASAESIGTGNTITNYYGAYLQTPSGTTITNKWGLFQQDTTSNNYFGGNLLINTTTDAGFKLDVNGNTRVKGAGATGSTNAFVVQNSSGSNALIITNGLTTNIVGDLQLENSVLYWNGGNQIRNISNGVLRITNSSNSDFTRLQFGGGTTSFPSLQRSGSALCVVDGTGTFLSSLLIGTTTDAGFKLDVNGIGRFGVNASSSSITIGQTATNTGYIINATGFAGSQYAYRFNNANGGVALFGGNNQAVIHRLDGGYQGNTALQINGSSTVSGTSYLTSSILELNSTIQGFLPPRMTQAQRNAIASPAIGLEIYQTDATEGKYIYKSSGWTYIG